MQLIPETNVPNWSTSGSDRWPYAADVCCPYCLRAVTFRLESWQSASPMHPRSIRARCPGCGTYVTFVWLGVLRTESGVPSDFGLYMHPAAPVERAPISGLPELVEIPEPLRRA